MYSHIERDSCHTIAQWLFNEHGPYLQAEGLELGPTQAYFGLQVTFASVISTALLKW